MPFPRKPKPQRPVRTEQVPAAASDRRPTPPKHAPRRRTGVLPPQPVMASGTWKQKPPVDPRVILVKCPTRSRPAKFFDTLSRYRSMESGKHLVLYLVSCDADDKTMNNHTVRSCIEKMGRVTVCYGPNKSKIEANNADIHGFNPTWQILVAISDDMIPQAQGWDDIIAREMEGEDAVWFYDGIARGCCTLSIMSRRKYEEQGYVYCPEYRSVFCDNEWTETAKPRFIPFILIRHVYPRSSERDALLVHNESFWDQDKATYERRKKAGFPKVKAR